MAERVTFDRSLYVPEAVEAAAAADREHARIEVTRAADCTVATLSAVDEDSSGQLVNAFCNHVLHETLARLHESRPQEGV